jgi:hypothetical protein
VTLHEIEVAADGIRDEIACDGAHVEALIAAHPDMDPRVICGTRLIIGHVIWPSIEGNPPVFRDRPYFNAPRP